MAWQKIPVNVPLWSNVDEAGRFSVAEQRYNVIKDLAGSTIRRPGLSEFSTGLPLPVKGLFYWEHTDRLYAVSKDNLYEINDAGTATEIGSSVLGFDPKHASFAESSDFSLVTTGAIRRLFVTDGGRIVYYGGPATTVTKLDGTYDPVESSHIICFASYLMSNEKSDPKYDESVLRSVVANPISFVGNYFSAENKTDKINAIHTAWDEIACFGSKSIENFYNDGDTPISAIPGATIQDGTFSPWSIQFDDTANAYFYLNSKKRVSMLSGRIPQPISAPVDDILGGDYTLIDAEGDLFTLGGKTLYLLTVGDRTLVYDFTLNEWVGEWSNWNSNLSKFTRFRGRKFLNIPQWGKTLCCDYNQGTIYDINFDTYQDNGKELRSVVRTGWTDHGMSGVLKSSAELKLRLKRGKMAQTATTDVEPKLLLRWRDDGNINEWSNYREINLGFTGDYEFYHSEYMLGSYYSRQYEFVCTDNVPFSIIDVEEDVTGN